MIPNDLKPALAGVRPGESGQSLQITSPGNPRIVEARKLRQRKYRQASALFLVEGLQLLHMAKDGRGNPHEILPLRRAVRRRRDPRVARTLPANRCGAVRRVTASHGDVVGAG